MTEWTLEQRESKSSEPPPLRDFGAELESRVRKLQTLLHSQGQQSGHVKALLAQLRQSVGKEPGSVPGIWELTIAGLPGRAVNDAPTPEERAAHAALTLYAVHQQSQRHPMHVRGRGLGQSVRGLAAANQDREKAIRRRLDAAATAITFGEALHHLRGLIQQLRSHESPMDYGMFADDLLMMQRPGGMATVRRRWGRQYYRTDKTSNRDTAPAGSSDTHEEQE